MKKTVLLFVISLAILGGFATLAEEVEVPFEVVKSSCYDEIDMTKSEFPLSKVGKECVKEDWLEENLSEDEHQTEKTKENQELVTKDSFEISRSEIFDLLENPQKIEPDLSSGWQYAVTGWERSDLSDGTPRWMTTTADEVYLYELIGDPANKFTFMGEITGETQNSQEFLLRSSLVLRAIGIEKENTSSVLTDLVEKAAENPNTKFKVERDGVFIQMQFIRSMSTISLTLVPVSSGTTEQVDDDAKKAESKPDREETSKNDLRKSVRQIFYEAMGEDVNWGNNKQTLKEINLIKQVGSGGEYLVKISYRVNDNLSSGMIRDGMLRDAMDFAERLFSSPKTSEIVEYMLMPEFKLVDQYGNESEDQVAKIVVSRGLAEKINWDNMYPDRFLELVEDEGQLWLHQDMRS